MEAYPWSESVIGAVENWPHSLKTAIQIILKSPDPMSIFFGGGKFINLYNDAYISVLGQRHPAVLGQSALEVWGEMWAIVGAQAEEVLQTGQSSQRKDVLLMTEHDGRLEETHATFSYTPITEMSGETTGVLCSVTDETERVINARRLRTVTELGVETARAQSVDETCQISAGVMAQDPYDIPFALIYVVDREHQCARLVSTTYLEAGTPLSPDTIDLTTEAKSEDPWSINLVLATREKQVIHQLTHRAGPDLNRIGDHLPSHAIALPLLYPHQEPLGVLIAGISPYQTLDDDYQDFFDLVAGQIARAIAQIPISGKDHEESVHRSAQHSAPEDVDHLKTTLLSRIYHELCTPLTLMLNPLNDALADPDEPLSDRQRQRIEMAQRNGLRVLEWANTLLDSSQLGDVSLEEESHLADGGMTAYATGADERKQRINPQPRPYPAVSSLSSNAQLLIVSANAKMREYIGQVLSQQWKIEIVPTAAIALQRIHQKPPDLVLTHLTSPEAEDVQLLSELRANPKTKNIPVILLSAWFEKQAAIHRIDAGANDHLTTPLSAHELITRVDTQLQLTKLRQEKLTNHLKDQVLAAITEELKSPLALVLGWVRLLQMKDLNKTKRAGALAAIERNTEFQAKLLKDLLDVSNILSGTFRLKPQLVDLVQLVQRVMARWQEVAEAKGICLTESVSKDGSLPIVADGDRLRQAIDHLLDHALKFTPPEGKINVQLKRTGSDLQLIVTDTGLEIQPDTLPSIFNTFNRADRLNVDPCDGSEIGLMISRHLVELHGGTLTIDSPSAEMGIIFTIKLPCTCIEGALTKAGT